MTRSQNSFYNVITGIGANLLLVTMNFVTRTLFVRFLGTSYLGIEGLFTNILSVLSLADLGIGYAISFKLYKPIEENDRQRIRVLLKLFRNAYLVIGAAVMAAGLCLIPLLPYLVRDYDRFAQLGLSAPLIFSLYLFGTAGTYWAFAYKTSFVHANQKSYVLTVAGYVISIVSSALQIVALVVFRSFLLYSVIHVCFQIAPGLVGGIICDRRYPIVREKTNERISREEMREFFRDCSSLLLYKVHNVLINASDNIVLSAIYGLETVGLYANYLVVKNALRNLLDSVLTAVQASLGSIYSTGNLDWSRLMFRVVHFLTIWIYGIGAIGLAVLVNEFIPLWLGSSEYVITSWTFQGTVIRTPLALFLGIEMFIIGHRQLFGIFREAMGLFQYYKYRPLFSVAVNLAVCIPGVYFLGPVGCVISTVIAGLTTNMVFDPIVIHRYALKTPTRPFVLRSILYAAVIAAAGALTWWVCGRIRLGGILGFLAHGCVCVLVPSLVMTVCFFRTEEFRVLLQTAKEVLRKKR